MDVRDISSVPQNLKAYGGLACLKIGVTLEGKDYLVKFPGNLKAKNLKNVELSYSNGPVCEYLGSHLFEKFNIPVHHTDFAIRKGKLVTLCEDFVRDNCKLAEFRELKATFEPAFVNANGDITDGTASDLDEALLVMRNHPTLKHVPEIENFFWKVFIVDAFIGNPDRNNGNWGVLIINNQRVEIAPVYDNGNSLNDKWDTTKMQQFLADEFLLLNEAYKGKVCFFTKNDKKVNPFRIIESGEYHKCTEALHDLLKITSINEIISVTDNCDFLNETQKIFYKTILTMRWNKLTDISKSLPSQIIAF